MNNINLIDMTSFIVFQESKVDDDKMQIIKDIMKDASKFKYGFLVNDKPMTDGSKMIIPYMNKYYKTLSLADIEKYKVGICYDHSRYISNKLEENGIDFNVYYIQAFYPDFNIVLRHGFVVANLDESSFIYIETSASPKLNRMEKCSTKNEAIDEAFKTLNKTAASILPKFNDNNVLKDIIDITDVLPPSGTSYRGYVDNAINNGKIIKLEAENDKRLKKLLKRQSHLEIFVHK